MRQKDFDVMSGRAKILRGRVRFRLRARNDFELQRLARCEINYRFIRSFAAFANLVEMKMILN
jgi:hypothetical protein